MSGFNGGEIFPADNKCVRDGQPKWKVLLEISTFKDRCITPTAF